MEEAESRVLFRDEGHPSRSLESPEGVSGEVAIRHNILVVWDSSFG